MRHKEKIIETEFEIWNVQVESGGVCNAFIMVGMSILSSLFLVALKSDILTIIFFFLLWISMGVFFWTLGFIGRYYFLIKVDKKFIYVKWKKYPIKEMRFEFFNKLCSNGRFRAPVVHRVARGYYKGKRVFRVIDERYCNINLLERRMTKMRLLSGRVPSGFSKMY